MIEIIWRQQQQHQQQKSSSIFGFVGSISYYTFLCQTILFTSIGIWSADGTSSTLILADDTAGSAKFTKYSNRSSSSSTGMCMLPVLHTMKEADGIGSVSFYTFRRLLQIFTFLLSIQLLIFGGGSGGGCKRFYNHVSIVIVSFVSITMRLFTIQEQKGMIQMILGNILISECLLFLSFFGYLIDYLTTTTTPIAPPTMVNVSNGKGSINTSATYPIITPSPTTAAPTSVWKHLPTGQQKQRQQNQLANKSKWDAAESPIVQTVSTENFIAQQSTLCESAVYNTSYHERISSKATCTSMVSLLPNNQSPAEGTKWIQYPHENSTSELPMQSVALESSSSSPRKVAPSNQHLSMLTPDDRKPQLEVAIEDLNAMLQSRPGIVTDGICGYSGALPKECDRKFALENISTEPQIQINGSTEEFNRDGHNSLRQEALANTEIYSNGPVETHVIRDFLDTRCPSRIISGLGMLPQHLDDNFENKNIEFATNTEHVPAEQNSVSRVLPLNRSEYHNSWTTPIKYESEDLDSSGQPIQDMKKTCNESIDALSQCIHASSCVPMNYMQASTVSVEQCPAFIKAEHLQESVFIVNNLPTSAIESGLGFFSKQEAEVSGLASKMQISASENVKKSFCPKQVDQGTDSRSSLSSFNYDGYRFVFNSKFGESFEQDFKKIFYFKTIPNIELRMCLKCRKSFESLHEWNYHLEGVLHRNICFPQDSEESKTAYSLGTSAFYIPDYVASLIELMARTETGKNLRIPLNGELNQYLNLSGKKTTHRIENLSSDLNKEKNLYRVEYVNDFFRRDPWVHFIYICLARAYSAREEDKKVQRTLPTLLCMPYVQCPTSWVYSMAKEYVSGTLYSTIISKALRHAKGNVSKLQKAEHNFDKRKMQKEELKVSKSKLISNSFEVLYSSGQSIQDIKENCPKPVEGNLQCVHASSCVPMHALQTSTISLEQCPTFMKAEDLQVSMFMEENEPRAKESNLGLHSIQEAASVNFKKFFCAKQVDQGINSRTRILSFNYDGYRFVFDSKFGESFEQDFKKIFYFKTIPNIDLWLCLKCKRSFETLHEWNYHLEGVMHRNICFPHDSEESKTAYSLVTSAFYIPDYVATLIELMSRTETGKNLRIPLNGELNQYLNFTGKKTTHRIENLSSDLNKEKNLYRVECVNEFFRRDPWVHFIYICLARAYSAREEDKKVQRTLPTLLCMPYVQCPTSWVESMAKEYLSDTLYSTIVGKALRHVKGRASKVFEAKDSFAEPSLKKEESSVSKRTLSHTKTEDDAIQSNTKEPSQNSKRKLLCTTPPTNAKKQRFMQTKLVGYST